MSRAKRRRRNRRFLKYTLSGLLAISVYSFYNHTEQVGFVGRMDLVETPLAPLPDSPATATTAPTHSYIDLAQTNSPHVILLDFETGKTLAEKKSDETVFPASLTKIMTVLVALDHLADLDQEILMEPAYFEGLFEARASISGFQEGEKTTVRELLYGAILPSGADACLALAHLVAGSEAEFITLMNEKASDLGMRRTHYANATGLHDTANVSSVADISRLVLAALQNPVFYEVFTTLQHEVPATNINAAGFIMDSTIFHQLAKVPELNGTMIGGKTGFTEQAGLCLASIGEIAGKKYVLVTAGAGAIPDFPVEQDRPIEEPLHIEDAATIYRQLVRGMNHVPDY